MKAVTIIRGVSGSGKTTLGGFLTRDESGVICCADDFFTNEYTGEYNFDPSKLAQAHKYCQTVFDNCITNEVENIVVNNTSTKFSEFQYYKTKAGENGYTVFVVITENWHGGENQHGVPEEILERQVKNLKNSFKPL